MYFEDVNNKHLDSAGMRFVKRYLVRPGILPALLACLALGPLLAGCGEDRSNLIPTDTSDSLISKFNRVQDLAADGECFAAQDVAASAQAEIESLGGSIDPELKRSLIDGVTDLQVFAGDPEKCTQAETTTTEQPTETEETLPETDGTTGETGTTDSAQIPQDDQEATTDEKQDSNQQQESGAQNETTPPATNPTTPSNPETPTNPTTPTEPTTPTPDPSGPGSGGLGPG